MVRRLPFILPLVIFVAIAFYFWVGLGRNPQVIPSVLIGQPVPAFDLPPIQGLDRGLSSEDLQGEVALLNVFGSWCVACLAEHPMFMRLAAEGTIPIYGIDWRERSPEAGPAWLAKHGNPYRLVGDDRESKAAIALGVGGAPETFIVDKNGIIRFRQVGPITPDVWNEEVGPFVRMLQAEGRGR
ncbi:MAG: DsbE family thiol:disulfide interchange protein [Rhodospirillales bacterium]|nr:DsbE family thiol:disulfide interchange protein [Rhodospirillales bacterium]